MFYEMLCRYLISTGFTVPTKVDWSNIVRCINSGCELNAITAIRDVCIKRTEVVIEVPAGVCGTSFTQWVLDNATKQDHIEQLPECEAHSIVRWYVHNQNVFN